MNLWSHLSSLGDVVTMGFTAAMIAAGLLFGRAWHAAFVWCLLIGMGMTLVVASKVAFLTWGWGICSLSFTGFSGHATRAMAIAPVFVYLLLNRTSRTLRQAGVVLAIAFGFAVGVSRLALHVHSLSEVVSGWLLGGGIAFLFIRSGRDLQDFQLKKFAAMSGVLILPMLPAPGVGATQQVLVEFSRLLSGREAVFSRQDCALPEAGLMLPYKHQFVG
jgi:membrane-associated phospholipid phosphatase